MFRKIILFLFFFALAWSEEYPQMYSQLSHPLFTSAKEIQRLSHIESIHEQSLSYLKELENLKKFGFKIDKIKDNEEIKLYLSSLRKLQKDYDSILNELHKQIVQAIQKDDYESFVLLTTYEFDGLLRSRSLYNRSLTFYEKNKKTKRIEFFEEKIQHQELERATSEEFFNEVKTSTFSSSGKKSSKKRKVHLQAKDLGKYIVVSVENLNPYSVTVNVKSEYENLDYDSSIKNLFALKSGEKREYIKLYKRSGTVEQSYGFAYSWIIGSVDAQHRDDYIYRLPYARGTTHMVSQGYNGTYTHKGHSQYAIDFAMDEGTKVYAARGGKVVKTKEDSNKGGVGREFSKYGNYVTIEHDDSTFATYYHIKQHGAVVRVGDKVDKGAFIAYSGNTGYSSGPHLHLAVFKASSATRTQTIPIHLLSEDGVIHTPKKGTLYTAK